MGYQLNEKQLCVLVITSIAVLVPSCAVTTPAETRTFSYNDVTYLATASTSSGYGYSTSNATYDIIQTRQSAPTGGDITQDAGSDGWGRVVSQSAVYRAGGAAFWSQYSYDALSRISTITPVTGGQISYQYAGNEATVTDRKGEGKSMSTTNPARCRR